MVCEFGQETATPACPPYLLFCHILPEFSPGKRSQKNPVSKKSILTNFKSARESGRRDKERAELLVTKSSPLLKPEMNPKSICFLKSVASGGLFRIPKGAENRLSLN